MDVPMELSRIVISEHGENQIIFLREKNGDRTFPILIGINEAMAIDRRLKGKESPRPMTHDLLCNIMKALGGELEKIVIRDLQDHVFFATLHIRHGEEVVHVDARPSDAIALGVAYDTPIFVNEHVINSVLNEPASKEERLNMLRERLHDLRLRIADLAQQLADPKLSDSVPASVIDEQQRRLKDMRTEYEIIDRVLRKFS